MTNNKEFIVNLTEEDLFSGLYNTIWLHDESLQDIIFEYQGQLPPTKVSGL